MFKNKKIKHTKSTLLIWDSVNKPPHGEWTLILWREFVSKELPGAVSIPTLIEENSEKLRKRYLAWIYNLGETITQDRRLVDHLEIRNGFSYWWMTLLAEKCNFAKSRQIEDAIKLIAFVDWLEDRVPDHIVLVSTKATLVETIQNWCASKDIGFNCQRGTKDGVPTSFLRDLYAGLPHVIRAPIWLAHHVGSRWSLRGAGLQAWRNQIGGITLISYLLNLAPGAATAGVFESRYWGHLPETLRQEGIKTHWLHLYIKDGVLPTPKAAARQIHRFNQTGGGIQSHATLDSFLSITVVGKALRDWLRLLCTGMGLQMQRHMPKLGELNLWPLFKNDWKESVIGATALRNTLTLNLFESAFGQAPPQRLGVYLQENMDWEYAALHAWKTNQPGRIIGCPHTSVRYWDMRYFFDPRVYPAGRKNPMPRPDQVAVNGPAACEAYLQGGYPAAELVDVEALRFVHLNRAGNASPEKNRLESRRNFARQSNIRLLVLGEYSKITTAALMQLLQDSVTYLSQTLSIIVKPHPACPINPKAYPGLPMTLSTQPLAELSEQGDIAFTGAVTTAGLDAYCLGLPVISFLNPGILNMSPMRGHAGVTFVSTPEECANAIRKTPTATRPETTVQHFFNLDMGLPRWKKLFGGAIIN